jgi:hypothetical protein
MKRIVKRMSYVNPKQDLNSVEFFLTSTEFEQHKYQSCADNFKRRLGVSGSTDLFVLRNVVMSPFPTAGNFVSMLAGVFRRIVEEEVKICQLRNSTDPAIHRFVIQGSNQSGKLFLAYQPFFHEADCLTQLILAADMDEEAAAAYHEARQNSTKYATFHVATTSKVRLSDILLTGQFAGTLSKVDLTKDLWSLPATLKHLRVIKGRSLATKHLDADYPATFTPFYLYGTSSEGDQHVSHILSRAPNIHLVADAVQLQLDVTLSELSTHLEDGCIAFATEIREKPWQPFFRDLTNLACPEVSKFFFLPGRTLEISVYADPRGAEEAGPGLLEGLGEPLAKGCMTLEGKVYVDAKHINEDGLEGLVWDGSEWTAPDMVAKENVFAPAPAPVPDMENDEAGNMWSIGVGVDAGKVGAGLVVSRREVDGYFDAKERMSRGGARSALLAAWMGQIEGTIGRR